MDGITAERDVDEVFAENGAFVVAWDGYGRDASLGPFYFALVVVGVFVFGRGEYLQISPILEIVDTNSARSRPILTRNPYCHSLLIVKFQRVELKRLQLQNLHFQHALYLLHRLLQITMCRSQ